jgi:hypothetical protein
MPSQQYRPAHLTSLLLISARVFSMRMHAHVEGSLAHTRAHMHDHECIQIVMRAFMYIYVSQHRLFGK